MRGFRISGNRTPAVRRRRVAGREGAHTRSAVASLGGDAASGRSARASRGRAPGCQVNTPAHLVVNLALLGGGARRGRAAWIALGALLPDLPMFGFFAWQRFVEGASAQQIWGSLYFDPQWQVFFDVFNSLPLLAVGWLLARRARRSPVELVFASAIVHALCDFGVHREDGHRHLWPLSDWRYMSPLSYWDPAYGGRIGAGLEWLLVAAASAVLWRRHPRRPVRAALVLLNAVYGAGWIGFYLRGSG